MPVFAEVGLACVLSPAAVAAIAGALAPLAAADAVYHTQHLALNPVGGAPLHRGFVQNAKAEGPRVYAHELFTLNGAAPNTTYTVTNWYVDDEWDVVRSRGLRATTRTAGTTSG